MSFRDSMAFWLALDANGFGDTFGQRGGAVGRPCHNESSSANSLMRSPQSGEPHLEILRLWNNKRLSIFTGQVRIGCVG